MTILIIDTYYNKYLESIYAKNRLLESYTYNDQLNFLLSSKFGTSDAYSRNFKRRGFDAHDVIANCIPLQLMWAKENSFPISPLSSMLNPKFNKLIDLDFLPNINDILFEQIKKLRPNVVYIQDIKYFSPYFIDKIRPYTRFIVGQIASPLPKSKYLQSYDLILSSLPNIVNEINNSGINCSFLPLGFDQSVLEFTAPTKKLYDVSFVGGYTKNHKKSVQLMEHLAAHCDINFWGYGFSGFNINQNIVSKYQGQVWGLDMYEIVSKSRIVINRHLDISHNYCNNMRMFEATGMGSLLLTDCKSNLNDYFDVGNEVMCYKSPEECVEIINLLLSQSERLNEIASNGQKKTLSLHTYENQIDKLINILDETIGFTYD